MRTSSVRDIKTSAALRQPLVPSARSLVLAQLQQITSGRLLLTDGDDSYSFGECADKARVTGRIEVLDARLYTLMLQRGMLGAAEAYMQGWWQTPDLVALIRVMARNLPSAARIDRRRSLWQRLALAGHALFHRNTLAGSRRNIAAHYDLGNDFFALFLDRSMMYSSAIYADGEQDLERAAAFKLDEICRKLSLSPADHVLEIGSGWGGFACHAARHYGCRVTTTTISREQYRRACQRVADEGLSDRVTVLLQDYRELQGQYDKLVSIEMIEAVGHEFYGDYFSCCSSLLKPEGQMLIQAILMADQRYDMARRHTDFIKRYIFPGGCLPSVSEIATAVARHSDMQLTALDDISYDYAKTLADWRQRFLQQLPAVRAQGFDEAFVRMWDFYFCYCQAGFMERSIHTAQLVFSKPGWRDPRYPCH